VDLTKLILALASLLPPEDNITDNSLVEMGSYNGLTGRYSLYGLKSDTNSNGVPIATTSSSKLFIIKTPSGQFGLMKISADQSSNDSIVNEYEAIHKLQSIAHEVDVDCAKKNLILPNYGAFFPEVIEIFNAGSRKAMFLGFVGLIESYKQLLPLSSLIKKERVDLQTGHWILGKYLKILSFIHDCGYSVGLVNPTNILLETSLHAVLILDFSLAQPNINSSIISQEISSIAKIVWQAAGGSDSQSPPHDSDIMSLKNYDLYLSFISNLIKGTNDDTDTVLAKLYELSDNIWPKVPKEDGTSGLKRQFHPWSTYSKLI